MDGESITGVLRLAWRDFAQQRGSRRNGNRPYLIKGMWKKGLALFVVCAAVVIPLGFGLDYLGYGTIANALGYGISAVFASRANIDYYKKMLLNDNGWW